jgi:hypothetical protein
MDQTILMYGSIIFLDVDGVLCLDGKTFNLRAVNNLVRIVKETSAEIVLSSNWRLYDHYKRKITELLAKENINIIGCTISYQDARPFEIWYWVFRHKPKRWIAIDDRNLINERGGMLIEKHVIQTMKEIGLQREQASFAIDLLLGNVA